MDLPTVLDHGDAVHLKPVLASLQQQQPPANVAYLSSPADVGFLFDRIQEKLVEVQDIPDPMVSRFPDIIDVMRGEFPVVESPVQAVGPFSVTLLKNLDCLNGDPLVQPLLRLLHAASRQRLAVWKLLKFAEATEFRCIPLELTQALAGKPNPPRLGGRVFVDTAVIAGDREPTKDYRFFGWGIEQANGKVPVVQGTAAEGAQGYNMLKKAFVVVDPQPDQVLYHRKPFYDWQELSLPCALFQVDWATRASKTVDGKFKDSTMQITQQAISLGQARDMLFQRVDEIPVNGNADEQTHHDLRRSQLKGDTEEKAQERSKLKDEADGLIAERLARARKQAAAQAAALSAALGEDPVEEDHPVEEEHPFPPYTVEEAVCMSTWVRQVQSLTPEYRVGIHTPLVPMRASASDDPAILGSETKKGLSGGSMSSDDKKKAKQLKLPALTEAERAILVSNLHLSSMQSNECVPVVIPGMVAHYPALRLAHTLDARLALPTIMVSVLELFQLARLGGVTDFAHVAWKEAHTVAGKRQLMKLLLDQVEAHLIELHARIVTQVCFPLLRAVQIHGRHQSDWSDWHRSLLVAIHPKDGPISPTPVTEGISRCLYEVLALFEPARLVFPVDWAHAAATITGPLSTVDYAVSAEVHSRWKLSKHDKYERNDFEIGFFLECMLFEYARALHSAALQLRFLMPLEFNKWSLGSDTDCTPKHCVHLYRSLQFHKKLNCYCATAAQPVATLKELTASGVASGEGLQRAQAKAIYRGLFSPGRLLWLLEQRVKTLAQRVLIQYLHVSENAADPWTAVREDPTGVNLRAALVYTRRRLRYLHGLAGDPADPDQQRAMEAAQASFQQAMTDVWTYSFGLLASFKLVTEMTNGMDSFYDLGSAFLDLHSQHEELQVGPFRAGMYDIGVAVRWDDSWLCSTQGVLYDDAVGLADNRFRHHADVKYAIPVGVTEPSEHFKSAVNLATHAMIHHLNSMITSDMLAHDNIAIDPLQAPGLKLMMLGGRSHLGLSSHLFLDASWEATVDQRTTVADRAEVVNVLQEKVMHERRGGAVAPNETAAADEAQLVTAVRSLVAALLELETTLNPDVIPPEDADAIMIRLMTGPQGTIKALPIDARKLGLSHSAVVPIVILRRALRDEFQRENTCGLWTHALRAFCVEVAHWVHTEYELQLRSCQRATRRMLYAGGYAMSEESVIVAIWLRSMTQLKMISPVWKNRIGVSSMDDVHFHLKPGYFLPPIKPVVRLAGFVPNEYGDEESWDEKLHAWEKVAEKPSLNYPGLCSLGCELDAAIVFYFTLMRRRGPEDEGMTGDTYKNWLQRECGPIGRWKSMKTGLPRDFNLMTKFIQGELVPRRQHLVTIWPRLYRIWLKHHLALSAYYLGPDLPRYVPGTTPSYLPVRDPTQFQALKIPNADADNAPADNANVDKVSQARRNHQHYEDRVAAYLSHRDTIGSRI